MRKVLYLFGQLSDQDIEWIVDHGEARPVPVGGVIIHQGVPVDALFILLRGRLSVSLPSLGDREIARLQAGEVVGEMSFVDARPPSATVTALEDSTVFAVPKPALGAHLEENLGFAARFYKALAIYLSTTVRERHRMLGYGSGVELPEEDDPDELDPIVLDGVHLAGERFDRLLKKVLES